MDRNLETKEFPMKEFPAFGNLTTRYATSFLLSLDLKIDGKKPEFSGINSSRYLSNPQRAYATWQ